MKAVRMTDYGGPEVLVYEDAPEPVAGDDDLLVEVHAASVNPVDWKIRQGGHRASSSITMPHILGVDFSGVVRGVGDNVSGFSEGDEVFGVGAQSRDGGYAEMLAIGADQVSLKPESLSHVESAAIALTGLTALYSLDDYAHVAKDDTVLIHAGAGGVGSFGSSTPGASARPSGLPRAPTILITSNRTARTRWSITTPTISPGSYRPAMWFMTRSAVTFISAVSTC